MVDGVPARKRRFAGGASGIDCSTLVPSSISTSPSSDEGKSRAGGDDIANGVGVQHRQRGEQDATRRVHFEFRAGSITIYLSVFSGNKRSGKHGLYIAFTRFPEPLYLENRLHFQQ